MSHIHTEPGEHDHTASALVMRMDGDEPRLLLHMHKKLGRYLQFGGHIETTETPWDAVKHELLEESGYEMSQIKVLQPKKRIKAKPGPDSKFHPMPLYHNTHVFNDTHWHTDVAYAFVTSEEPNQPLGEAESDEMILLSRDQLEALPAEQTSEAIKAAGLFFFDVCLKEWEEVDPATFD